MANFASAEQIKEHLDVILEPYLGKWGDNTPRTWISPPSVAPSNDESLQCVIYRIQTGEVYGAGSLNLKEGIYEVILVNYADDDMMSQAIQAIEADDRIVQEKRKVYQPRASDRYERCRLFLKSPTAVNRT